MEERFIGDLKYLSKYNFKYVVQSNWKKCKEYKILKKQISGVKPIKNKYHIDKKKVQSNWKQRKVYKIRKKYILGIKTTKSGYRIYKYEELLDIICEIGQKLYKIFNGKFIANINFKDISCIPFEYNEYKFFIANVSRKQENDVLKIIFNDWIRKYGFFDNTESVDIEEMPRDTKSEEEQAEQTVCCEKMKSEVKNKEIKDRKEKMEYTYFDEIASKFITIFLINSIYNFITNLGSLTNAYIEASNIKNKDPEIKRTQLHRRTQMIDIMKDMDVIGNVIFYQYENLLEHYKLKEINNFYQLQEKITELQRQLTFLLNDCCHRFQEHLSKRIVYKEEHKKFEVILCSDNVLDLCWNILIDRVTSQEVGKKLLICRDCGNFYMPTGRNNKVRCKECRELYKKNSTTISDKKKKDKMKEIIDISQTKKLNKKYIDKIEELKEIINKNQGAKVREITIGELENLLKEIKGLRINIKKISTNYNYTNS